MDTLVQRVVLALGLAGVGFAQPQPVIVTWQQAVVLRSARMTPGADGSTVFTPMTTRQATIEDLRGVSLRDADGDGVVNLMDACPENPSCGLANGSYEQLRGPGAQPDPLAPVLLRFADATDLVDHILAENAEWAESPFAASDLIEIAGLAGFPPDVTAMWSANYACGKRARKRCQDRCQDQCPPPGRPCRHGHRDGRGHCLGPCLRDCAKIPRCGKKPRDRDDDDDDDDDRDEDDDRGHKGDRDRDRDHDRDDDRKKPPKHDEHRRDDDRGSGKKEEQGHSSDKRDRDDGKSGKKR